MRPDGGHAWMCDAGDFFEDDAGLATRLAARIEGGDDRVMFSREGAMFRLTSEDEPHRDDLRPDDYCLRRSYTVTLVMDCPTCEAEGAFAANWPDGYTHHPLANSDATVTATTTSDISSVLTGIGVVLWPELYKP